MRCRGANRLSSTCAASTAASSSSSSSNSGTCLNSCGSQAISHLGGSLWIMPISSCGREQSARDNNRGHGIWVMGLRIATSHNALAHFAYNEPLRKKVLGINSRRWGDSNLLRGARRRIARGEPCRVGRRQSYLAPSASAPCWSSPAAVLSEWPLRPLVSRSWPQSIPRSSKRCGKALRSTCRRACRFSPRWKKWGKVLPRKRNGGASAPGAICARTARESCLKTSLNSQLLARLGTEPLGRPLRIPHDVDRGIAHARHSQQALLHLIADLLLRRAAGCRQRHFHFDIFALQVGNVRRLHPDFIDQAEIDDVHRDLGVVTLFELSLIHISEPTRRTPIS